MQANRKIRAGWRAAAFLCAVFAFLSTGALAQWSMNPSVNTAVSLAANYQYDARVVSDGAGGAIVVWTDQRSGNAIYAQRVNAAGTVQWTANGVALSSTTGNPVRPSIISDGAGGAFIAWQSGSTTTENIYIQRVNDAGAMQWAAGGVPVTAATGSQITPALASDGAGGVLIAWEDGRSAGTRDIYAQRMDAAGNALWTADGVAVSTATGFQRHPVVVGDGIGGAIIAWDDNRSGNEDIYAQRVNAAGAVQWTANGVPISVAAGAQDRPNIVTDGARGAIVVWRDKRGANLDIYAQRIGPAGDRQWEANGVAIAVAAGDQDDPSIISDGLGGAIIAWRDTRNGTGNPDVYAQRINSSGVAQWTAHGTPVGAAVRAQTAPSLVTDGAGGAIIAWQDHRVSIQNHDIYAQSISASGALRWAANGVAISTAGGAQDFSGYAPGQLRQALASDGAGGAIIAWHDQRNGPNWDIYAQKVDRNGYLGDVAPQIVAVNDVANDRGGRVSVLWNASVLDAWPNQVVTSYTVWRGVRPAADAPIFWEQAGTVSAQRQPNYSFAVPTLSDGTTYFFKVTALGPNPLVYWDSAPQSGTSTANLP